MILRIQINCETATGPGVWLQVYSAWDWTLLWMFGTLGESDSHKATENYWKVVLRVANRS